MKIMTRGDDYKVINKSEGASIRKALNLPASATEGDIIAAIEAKKAAIEKAKQDVAYAKSMAAYRQSAEYKADVAKRENQRNTTNASLSFLKSTAIEAEMARRNEVEAAARAELKKIGVRTPGTATLKPQSTQIVDVNEATAASTVQTAYQQLRVIATQHARSANITVEAAMERVMMDAKNADLVAQERAERFGGAAYVENLPDL
jgi:hypothetical protein